MYHRAFVLHLRVLVLSHIACSYLTVFLCVNRTHIQIRKTVSLQGIVQPKITSIFELIFFI